MIRFRDGMLGPTAILLAICLVITAALAAVYNVTKPIIAAGEAAAANEARAALLPQANRLAEMTGPLPAGVTEAYKADNDAGYVFTAEAEGFGGPVVYMVGVDAKGLIVGIHMFSHSETPGLGTKIAEEDYLALYLGDVDPDSVDAVSGATRTTNSLKHSLKQALDAYHQMEGA